MIKVYLKERGSLMLFIGFSLQICQVDNDLTIQRILPIISLFDMKDTASLTRLIMGRLAPKKHG